MTAFDGHAGAYHNQTEEPQSEMLQRLDEFLGAIARPLGRLIITVLRATEHNNLPLDD